MKSEAEIAAFEKDREDRAAAERKARRIERFKLAGLPDRFIESNFPAHLLPLAVTEYKKEAGNLFVYGAKTGTGKTEAAAWLMKRIEAVSPLRVSRFVDAAALMLELRATYRRNASESAEGIARDYSTCDYLFLDDIGSENLGGDGGELLYAILNSRWANRRPTIFTSNLTPRAIITKYGEKIASRILAGVQVSFDTAASMDNRIKKA